MKLLPNISLLEEYIDDYYSKNWSEKLTYHNLEHVKDVFNASMLYAKIARFSDTDIKIIGASALFHDIDMCNHYYGHELYSANYAAQILPRFGFSEQHILNVKRTILSTCPSAVPCNNMEKLIRDCDLDYIGTDKYIRRCLDLKTEWENFGLFTFTNIGWYEYQLCFIPN